MLKAQKDISEIKEFTELTESEMKIIPGLDLQLSKKFA